MKHEFSPSPEPGPSKKIKTITVTAPTQVKMSILRWIGEPKTFSGDGEELHEFVGKYERATQSDMVLNLRGWDEDTNAFEYTPARGPLKFRYKRHAYAYYPLHSHVVEYGGIAAQDMPVKVRVCHVSQNPWPQVLAPRSGDAEQAPPRRSFTGPPFYFYECDWAMGNEAYGGWEKLPEDLGENALDLGRPDLPGQPCTGESEMSGPWVQPLYEKNEQKLPLGGRPFETQWARSEQWAVEASFKALYIKFFFYDDTEEDARDGEDSDEEDLPPLIYEYEVEATIRRVLLTAEYLGEL